MAHLRHPIVGDTRHGDGVHNRFFRERWGIHRLLLHAQQLSFNHPTSGDRISLTAELDEAFQDALEKTNLVSPE
jgi:tRNA pseudouridine65 synthase